MPLSRSFHSRSQALVFAMLVACLLSLPPGSRHFAPVNSVVAQDNVSTAGPSADPVPPVPTTEDADAVETTVETSAPQSLSLLWLLARGGWMMLLICAASVLMFTVVVERFLGLRRGKTMPTDLVDGLMHVGNAKAGFDPRRAYRLCQRYPSVAATVIRTMLLKIGRPHNEVERAVAETSQREADRMYANVRWLNLVAAVAPLLGLLGTVWGMIRAFFDTTQLPAGQNKADYLASGIYVALVTTLGGLAVAIPAAIFAHYFEGRIQSRLHQIEELLFHLLPHVERFEGRMRVSQGGLGDGDAMPQMSEEDAPANSSTSSSVVS